MTKDEQIKALQTEVHRLEIALKLMSGEGKDIILEAVKYIKGQKDDIANIARMQQEIDAQKYAMTKANTAPPPSHSLSIDIFCEDPWRYKP